MRVSRRGINRSWISGRVRSTKTVQLARRLFVMYDGIHGGTPFAVGLKGEVYTMLGSGVCKMQLTLPLV